MKKIAVITGASSGLGAEFARQLAAYPPTTRPEEIWLVARREDRLQALKAGLSVPCRLVMSDLTSSTDMEQLKQLLALEKPQIDYLVNAAGVGFQGSFSQLDWSRHATCLALNTQALCEVSYLCFPYLKRQQPQRDKPAEVYHVGSVAGFLPQPNYALYAASKDFVFNFSRALAREWKPYGIRVTCVLPNIMDTEFLTKAGFSESSLRVKKWGMEEPGKVVKYALKAGSRGKDVSLTSLPGRGLRLASKLLPISFLLWLEEKLGMY